MYMASRCVLIEVSLHSPIGSDLDHLGQWDAYPTAAISATSSVAASAAASYNGRLPISRVAALSQLRARAQASGGRLYGRTSLCIAPGYSFAMCDGRYSG